MDCSTAHVSNRPDPLSSRKHPLYERGANEVIPEEFETSVEISTRVLVRYLIPRDEIDKFSAQVRADGYEILRSQFQESTSFSDLRSHIPDAEIGIFRVNQGSPVVGESLAQIELRKIIFHYLRRSDVGFV
jgi:CPA2 family monovalent cation:H+ antiporter-2